MRYLTKQMFSWLTEKRQENTHKGNYGHVLVIGSGIGMPGASCLCAGAALKTGAGAVTVAVHPNFANSFFAGFPEAMIYPVSNEQDLAPLLSRASVCVVGPGLGEDERAKALFHAVIDENKPLVVDASALRLLANNQQKRQNWVLTPHPGEAAILLGTTTAKVQEDRILSLQRLQQLYGGCIVLKGHNTLIGSADGSVSVCKSGNPGMATAGMGDVLSGIIAGLLAQNMDMCMASELAVWLHATAGDRRAETYGERGILASDILIELQALINDK